MADPDYTIIDGFDKYFQELDVIWDGTTSAAQPPTGWDKVFDGEWTFSNGIGNALYTRAPIGVARGYSIGMNGTLYRSLPATYARAVGGVCWKTDIAPANLQAEFGIAGSHLTIQWATDGNLYLRRGNGAGTIIGTAAGAMIPLISGSTHFISWDVEPKNTGGSAKVWIDGTLVINYSGDTTSSATDGVNYVTLYGANSGQFHDHYYCDFYTTGGGSETPFLTNPVVYTDNPDSDSAVAFTPGTTMLGDAASFDWSTGNSGTNVTKLQRVLCKASGNLTDIYVLPWGSSATVKTKCAVYADSAGSPATLLGTSNEVTGLTQYSPKQVTFGTPVALTAGNYYWIAMRTDTSVAFLTRRVSGLGGLQYTATYATAFANPAASLAASSEFVMWGVISGATVRADILDVLNYSTQYAYNYSATAGQEDLFNVAALPGTPTGVHHVAIKTFSYRSDAGARTVDMRLKSGASTYSGSMTGITPNALQPNWIGTNFRKDPNGNIAWTKANLDASKFGYKLVT